MIGPGWQYLKPRAAASGVLLVGLFVTGCNSRVVNVDEPPIHVISDTPGNGRVASRGKIARVDYALRLPTGDEVLTATGYEFEVGAGAVIACVDEAIEGMRVGGRRIFECPPHRHWGRQGHGNIPPNTRLTVELALSRVR